MLGILALYGGRRMGHRGGMCRCMPGCECKVGMCVEFLGLDPAEASLWLVEWPERGAGGLPAPDLVLEMTVEGDGRRVNAYYPMTQLPDGRWRIDGCYLETPQEHQA